MNVTFAPRGILQIDDARIIFRNFTGRGDKFNREGDRNFAVVIEDMDIAQAMINEGWNVKIKPGDDREELPFMYLSIKVKFNGRGPSVYLESNGIVNKLDEEDVECLDDIDIISVDLDIRPYDWEVNGKTGRTGYLQSMHVTQRVDRFAERYMQSPKKVDSEVMPF